MLFLKCDKCKKEVSKVIRFFVEFIPYQIGDEKQNAQLQPNQTKKFEFCENCFKKLLGSLMGETEHEMSYNE